MQTGRPPGTNPFSSVGSRQERSAAAPVGYLGPHAHRPHHRFGGEANRMWLLGHLLGCVAAVEDEFGSCCEG